MYKNEKDSNNSALLGQKGEDLFVQTIEKRKHIKVKKANWNEQVNEHWDYKLIGNNYEITVDVKAMKRTGRWQGKPQDEIIWIEFFNVAGNEGWLYGNADCFSFQCHDGFLCVGRRKLTELCEKLVGFSKDEITLENSNSKKGLYKLYTRKGRKDIITMIKKKDILSIEHEYIKY